MENQEALKSIRLIRHPPDSVHGDLNLFLPNGVMTSSIVVGSILFASYQLFRMEQLSVCSNSDLVHHSRLQVHENRPGHVLAAPCLREEGVEGVVLAADGLVAGHGAVRLYAVLQAVQLPAGVAHLDSGLADVDADAFSLEIFQ